MNKKQIKWQKIGNLEWSEDLGVMDWHQACDKCKAIGGRLPERWELVELCDNHRDKIKDWSTHYYWSATTDSTDTTYGWSVALNYGYTSSNTKTNSTNYWVRCVR